jgi:hypothetical protein
MSMRTWRVNLSQCRHEMRFHRRRIQLIVRRSERPNPQGGMNPLEISHDLANPTHGKRGVPKRGVPRSSMSVTN